VPATTETFSLRIPDGWFVGDYDGPGSGTYHGRTASWIYGQGTPYESMTAEFELEYDGTLGRRATLQLTGLDGDDPAKHMISIVLNGTTIYEGPDPLPNDDCCGPSGPGNWGSALFEFSGELLQHHNSLTITNLEPGDCTMCPNYVMIDYAIIEFRVRQ